MIDYDDRCASCERWSGFPAADWCTSPEVHVERKASKHDREKMYEYMDDITNRLMGKPRRSRWTDTTDE